MIATRLNVYDGIPYRNPLTPGPSPTGGRGERIDGNWAHAGSHSATNAKARRTAGRIGSAPGERVYAKSAPGYSLFLSGWQPN